MELISPAFEHTKEVPPLYTCDGKNINPPLFISNASKDAKSLVLILDDPDAPHGTWVHWTVWNMRPDTKEIRENSVPDGATEGITSFGTVGYGGPCPPSETHRYFFKLYALDMFLTVLNAAKASDLMDAMKGHILAKAELIGLYERH